MTKLSKTLKNKQELLKPISEYYKLDKYRLISFLVKEGYEKQDIAKLLGVTPSAISHFLRRTKEAEEKIQRIVDYYVPKEEK